MTSEDVKVLRVLISLQWYNPNRMFDCQALTRIRKDKSDCQGSYTVSFTADSENGLPSVVITCEKHFNTFIHYSTFLHSTEDLP